MKKSFSAKIILLLLFCSVVVQAQPKTLPAWSYKFKTPILWQRVHSLGHVIVSTSEGLFAINPADGRLLWENRQFPSLNPDMYSEIPGTEFISISYLTDKSSTIPMQAIIEVVGGKLLFDSQKESIGVLSRHVLPSSGKLLVIGMKPRNLVASVLMYDIATGKQLWANDDLFKAEGGGKGLLAKLQTMSSELSSLQALSSEPLEIDAENILITHPNYVIRINSNTGNVVWKNSIQPSKRAGIYFSPYKKGVVYIGTEVESSTGSGFTTTSSSGATKEPQKFYYNIYYAYDVNTGASLWKQPAKENDLLNEVIVSDKGLIICPRSSQKPTINLVNYETGQTMWGNKGKGIKAQGSLVSYIPTEKGLLITTAFDNAWNNKAEEYYLNILDPANGKLLFEKSVKLKGDLVKTEMTPKGLLFVTTREVNILDTNSGTLLWASSIEAGNPFNSDTPRPFPTGENGSGKLYVYSPKEKAVFEVDKLTGTNRKITIAKIEFEGKEIPNAIDVVTDGLVLSSEQNIMKLGLDGTVKYNKYYPAPGQPALVRALLMAQAVRAAYVGAVASTYSAAFAQASTQTTDPAGKQVGSELSKQFGEVGQMGFAYSSRALKEFNARFKASKSTPNFVIMMTKQEKKGNQLIQVSKASGEMLAGIDIKNDKEPEYDLDQIYNFVYYRPTANDLVCYKL
jgi:hypothetical protein